MMMGPICGAPRCVWDLRATLGEGPVWSEGEQALYFVDIVGRAIHRYRPESGETMTWLAPNRPGFLVPSNDGTFLCGLKDGLHRFDPASGHFSLDTLVEPELPDNRINDGHVDRFGRLWFGTMHDAETDPTGSLYSVSQDQGRLHVHREDEGYIVSNGPALSPDGRTLYHNHSPARTVYAFDVGSGGVLSNRRVFATLQDGYPDGIAVDSAGFLWIGVWGGGRIERLAPDGTPVDPIPLPARNVTKVAFGGADYRTVFVTTARKGLSPEQLDAEPLTGGLFSFGTSIPGQKQAVFPLDRSIVL
ncbi:SMP-30/gluconolactonase/LRE family protein [Gluconacetobacter diazotrophicus]|nr:SMP-30/gluconolactonase/LRE family protein [Gluconacetobacter diazotrophicus]